jgi:hypothetical protein
MGGAEIYWFVLELVQKAACSSERGIYPALEFGHFNGTQSRT